MRLELESNTLALTFTETPESAFNLSDVLRQGIKAAQDGDRRRARALLLQFTETEPHNEDAWLWLASVSEYPEELMIFLTNVLDVNPNNERANEWMKTTKSLLAKTFVERGIAASVESRTDFARQCFYQAAAHDPKNEMAWLRLASIADTAEEKQIHLACVLAINPENADAQAALKMERDRAVQTLLRRASFQALNGERAVALAAVIEILHESPQHEDALILKAHLTDDFAGKIECFENVLEINPANEAACAGLSSLNALRNFAAPLETAETAQGFAPDNDFSETEFESESDLEETVSDLNEDETVEFKFEETFEDRAAEIDSASFAESASSENENRETEFFFGETAFEENAVVKENRNLETVSFDSFERSEENEQNEQNELELSDNVFELDEVKTESISNFGGEIFSDFETNDNFSATEDAPIASFAATEFEDEVFALDETAIVDDLSLPAADSSPVENISDNKPDQSGNDYSAVFEPHQSSFDEETGTVEAVEFYAEAVETSADISQGMVELFAGLLENSFACPFCNAENDVQSYACRTCRAVLSLSEMEMLLTNENADRDLVERAVERMEEERNFCDFDEYELMSLGIGHINLKNRRRGFLFLQQASKTNPNNVVLSAQVNALALRLEEIERREVKVNSDAPALPRTILVVDDSATVRKLISGKLEKSGHEVVCAVDGMDALAKLNEATPDLILLDITMPRMDGYQVCKMVRSNPATKNIPVVMISDKDGFFDKVRGRMAGTTGYITKPFGPETLMKALDIYIKNTHEQIVSAEI